MSLPDLLSAKFVKPNWEHQLREFELYCDAPARALAWTMRTGKTKAEVDKACHNYDRRNKIDGVLIFAPNGVHANWVNVEFPKHGWPGVKVDSLCWHSSELSAKRRNKLGRAALAAFNRDRAEWWKRLRAARHTPNLMVLAIPTEVMIRKDVRRVVAYFIKKRRTFVIFDESDDWGIPGSKRTKMARAIARRCVLRSILSGTMLTGSPLAAFTQFELLKKNALGFKDYAAFKEHICETEIAYGPNGKYPKIVGFKNVDDLRARMAPFMSVVLREEVKDMPALNFTPCEFEPTEEQLRIYRELHHSITVQIDKGEVSIGELAPRIQKLQQIFSGFLIDEYKKVHKIPGGNPRLDATIAQVHGAMKSVVWCQFKEDFRLLAAALTFEGIEFREYHGDAKDKEGQLKDFITNRKVRTLLGQPQAGARGRDMSAAERIIWHSHSFKARLRAQALERATAVGGGNIEIVDVIAPGPDKYILNVTAGRIQMNDSLTGDGMKKLIRSLAL